MVTTPPAEMRAGKRRTTDLDDIIPFGGDEEEAA
jgi:hypothetical protein